MAKKPKCEGCKKPATGTDREGVPLCDGCQLSLAAECVNDLALMCRHFAAGRLRWESLAGEASRGELCFNGLRHFTTVDDDGVPELPGGLRERLMAWKETGA